MRIENPGDAWFNYGLSGHPSIPESTCGVFLDTAMAHKVVAISESRRFALADSLSFNQTLDEDLLLYSAWMWTHSWIYITSTNPKSTGLLAMFQSMCENEMLRAIDNKLYRFRRALAARFVQSIWDLHPKHWTHME
ncbi:hypothetical protein TCAL_16836 [Tigriopus californicus]|uniref:Uncharacterized protein n=1 Tax=Tigriopus californicus TaxID=6832 RepID=A0A553PC79_TIGCA|nr:hypothetical protein TCAL_16836 [Tigriopus californicus]